MPRGHLYALHIWNQGGQSLFLPLGCCYFSGLSSPIISHLTHTPRPCSAAARGRSTYLWSVVIFLGRRRKEKQTGQEEWLGLMGGGQYPGWNKKYRTRDRQRKRRQKSAADWRKKSISQRGDFIGRTEKGMGEDWKFTDGVIDLEEKLENKQLLESKTTVEV